MGWKVQNPNFLAGWTGLQAIYPAHMIERLVICLTSVVYGDTNANLKHKFFGPSVVPMRAVLRSSLLLVA